MKKLNPNVKRFDAYDMLAFGRYLDMNGGMAEDILKHRFDCWSRGPDFRRKGTDFSIKRNKPNWRTE